MSKLLISITLCAFVGLAHAAPQSIIVVGEAPHQSSLVDADAVRGSYQLSDGRTLEVGRRGRTVVADLEGLPTTELLAMSATHLRSADGRMNLRFDAARNGNVYGVTLTLQRPDGVIVTMNSTGH